MQDPQRQAQQVALAATKDNLSRVRDGALGTSKKSATPEVPKASAGDECAAGDQLRAAAAPVNAGVSATQDENTTLSVAAATQEENTMTLGADELPTSSVVAILDSALGAVTGAASVGKAGLASVGKLGAAAAAGLASVGEVATMDSAADALASVGKQAFSTEKKPDLDHIEKPVLGDDAQQMLLGRDVDNVDSGPVKPPRPWPAMFLLCTFFVIGHYMFSKQFLQGELDATL